MKLVRLLMMATIATLIGGCMVGPDYNRPDLDLPKQWSEPLMGGETGAASSPIEWWTSFTDPMLHSLIERASSGSFDLRVAESRIKEARAVEDISGAGLWPHVNANAAYQRSQTYEFKKSDGISPSVTLTQKGASVAGTMAGPFGTMLTAVPDLTGGGNSALTISPGVKRPDRRTDLYQAGFDATWELDLFGGIRRGKEASRADTEGVEEARRGVLISVAAEVARNYFLLRSAQQRIETANKNIEAQTQALNIAQARFQAGLTNELDVKIAEAQLAASRSVVPVLETSIQLAIHRLGVLIGSTPGTLQQELVQKTPLASMPPEVPVGLPADILRRRPDIRMAERAVAAATARIGVAEADLYPRFVLTGSLTGSSTDFDGITRGANRLWSFGPGIHWPVFDGGRIRANIRVQNARQEQALVNYEKTVMTALEEVENALVAYAKEQNRLITLTEAVEANRRAVDIASSLYERGLINFLNVIDSERSLFASEDQQIESEALVLNNLVALYKALGGGWEKFYPDTAGPPNAAVPEFKGTSTP